MTEAERVAHIIRSPAAWLKLTVKALEASEGPQAEQYAMVGKLSTEGMHETDRVDGGRERLMADDE